MKIKTVAICLLSTSFLIACVNGEEAIPSNNGTTGAEHDIKRIEKNQSVNLPITVFENSDYDKFTGKKLRFSRKIDSVSISDFKDEADEIMFLERYGSTLDSYNLDLINDYKKVTINMSHSIEGDETYELWESFTLDENTSFVAGEEELSNNIVNQQIKYSSLDYRVGDTYDLTGNVVLAIPNDFVSEHLQLKTVKRQDKQVEVIYIDLQLEK